MTSKSFAAQFFGPYATHCLMEEAPRREVGMPGSGEKVLKCPVCSAQNKNPPHTGLRNVLACVTEK